MSWETASAVATIISSAVIVISAPIIVVQLVEMRRSRRLEVTLRLLDSLTTPEARRSRARVYRAFEIQGEPRSPEDVLAIDDVLGSLDRTWVLVSEGHLSGSLVADLYGEMISKVWSLTEKYVCAERQGRRGPNYRHRSEQLARLVADRSSKRS